MNSDNKLLTFTLNNHNTLTSSNVFSAINYKYQLLGLDYSPEQSHEHHGHIEVLFLLLIRLFFFCPFYWAQSKKEKLNCIDARSQCSRCPGHVVATANWRYADVLTKPICHPLMMKFTSCRSWLTRTYNSCFTQLVVLVVQPCDYSLQDLKNGRHSKCCTHETRQIVV